MVLCYQFNNCQRALLLSRWISKEFLDEFEPICFVFLSAAWNLLKSESVEKPFPPAKKTTAYPEYSRKVRSFIRCRAASLYRHLSC